MFPKCLLIFMQFAYVLPTYSTADCMCILNRGDTGKLYRMQSSNETLYMCILNRGDTGKLYRMQSSNETLYMCILNRGDTGKLYRMQSSHETLYMCILNRGDTGKLYRMQSSHEALYIYDRIWMLSEECRIVILVPWTHSTKGFGAHNGNLVKTHIALA